MPTQHGQAVVTLEEVAEAGGLTEFTDLLIERAFGVGSGAGGISYEITGNTSGSVVLAVYAEEPDGD